MIERMAGYQVAGKITLVTLYCQVGVHRIPRTEIMDHNKHNFTDFLKKLSRIIILFTKHPTVQDM